MILLNTEIIEKLEKSPDMILTDTFRQNKYCFNKAKKQYNPYFTNFNRFSGRYECSLVVHKGKITQDYQKNIEFLLSAKQIQKLSNATRINAFERLSQFYKSITQKTLSVKEFEKEFHKQISK